MGVLLFYPKDEVGQLVEKSGNVELSDWMKMSCWVENCNLKHLEQSSTLPRKFQFKTCSEEDPISEKPNL